jgi:hypothetical protein
VKIFAAQGAPPVSLTPVAHEKFFIRKVLIIFLEHLCVVELTYRYFSFKFSLRSQQSDIVPSISTGIKNTTDTGGAPSLANFSANF